MSDLKHLQLTEEQRSIAEGFIAIAKDLQSYKAAIARLAENQEAEHAKMLEMAKLLETVQEVWTKNFAELGALLNAQTKLLEGLRALVLPKDPPVN